MGTFASAAGGRASEQKGCGPPSATLSTASLPLANVAHRRRVQANIRAQHDALTATGRARSATPTPLLHLAYTTQLNIEMWLSLVERYVRDVEVAGSNPVISTKLAVFTAKEPQGSDTLRL